MNLLNIHSITQIIGTTIHREHHRCRYPDVIIHRERDTHEAHQLLHAANNQLLSGHIHESKVLLEKALLLAGVQSSDSVEVEDDAYFI